MDAPLEGRASTRVITLDELANAILQHLDFRSLTIVARSARFLHLPACRIIWRDMYGDHMLLSDGLTPLLDIVMPAPTTQGGPPSHHPSSISGTWERFHMYSSLITRLGLQRFRGDKQLTRIHAIHALNSSNRPLLPNLRELDVYSCKPEDVDAAAILIHPGLTHVGLYDTEHVTVRERENRNFHLGLFIAKLCNVVPSLEHLVLPNGTETGSLLYPTVKQAIATLPLRSLKVEYSILTQADIIGPLVKGNRVHTLYVQRPSDQVSQNTPNPSPSSYPLSSLSSVRSIYLTGTLRTVHNHVLDFSGLNITALDIAVANSGWMVSEVTNLCSTILVLADTLEDFAIHLWNEPSQQDPNGLSWDAFTPLLACGSMRSVKFRCNYETKWLVQDRHFEAMAMAWPLLRSFSLLVWGGPNSYTIVDQSDALTLSTLVHLAKHCSELRHVTLSHLFMGGSVPRPRRYASARTVESLTIESARIKSPADAAMFLAILWPRASVSTQDIAGELPDRRPGATEEVWEAMRKSLRLLRYFEELNESGNSIWETTFNAGTD